MKNKITIAWSFDRIELRKKSLFILLSFVLMIPWTVLGIVLSYSSWDHYSEIVLLFGGVTTIVSFPFLIFIPYAEIILVISILALWFFVLIGPVFLLNNNRPLFQSNAMLLTLQTGFSCIQSALGVLMIWGKYV